MMVNADLTWEKKHGSGRLRRTSMDTQHKWIGPADSAVKALRV